MVRNIRQSKPAAAQAKGKSQGKAPSKIPSKPQGKAKGGKAKGGVDPDEESVSDSGSEIGWDSDKDFGFGDAASDGDDYDDDYEEEGGILLSDMIGMSAAAKAPAKAPVKSKAPPAKAPVSNAVPTKLAKRRYEEEEDESDEDEEGQEEDDEESDEVDEDSEMVDDEDSDMEGMEDDSDGDVIAEEDDEDIDDEAAFGASDIEEGEEDESEDGDDAVPTAGGEDDWLGGSEDDYQDEDSAVEDDEDDERHEKLLQSLSKKLKPTHDASAPANVFKNVAESSSFADGKISLNALMDALQDTRGIAAVQAQLSSLDTARAAPQYVEKVIADRMERRATYQGKAADMDKWHDTVLVNRSATQLDLAQDKKYVPTYKSLVRKFNPTSDFEKEISMVVVSQKADDAGLLEREAQALAANSELSAEEIKQKQNELAKINRLMLYEQIKRHRINKIKSKAYRTLQRREKKRAAAKTAQDSTVEDEDLDAEDLEELREKNAYNRVKERMDLKHKNTSKWAKMALAFGHTNQALREAYHESVRAGHELTAKMSETVGNDDSDAEVDRFEGAESVQAQAQAELKDYLSALDRDGAPEVSGKFSKLFAMDFMQKAAERQKEEAREQAKALLKEIARMEEGDDDDDAQEDVSPEARAASLEKQAEHHLKKQKAQQQVAALIAPGAGMRIQKGAAVAVTAPVEEEVNPWVSGAPSAAVEPPSSEPKGKKAKAAPMKKANTIAPVTEPSATAAPKTAAVVVTVPAMSETKPSLQKAQKGKQKKGVKEQVPVAVTAPAEEKESTPATEAVPTPAPAPTKAKAKLLVTKTQEELVAAAFAGPDFAAEFAASKQQQIDDELGIKQKQMQVLKDVKAGWGDWAGPGAMEISPKILAKREKALLQIQKDNDVQRMQRKDFHKQQVVLSERRSKAAAKYKVTDIPHPFTSREEYERSLQMPVGEEWNAMHVVSKVTAPEVKTRAGRIIEPIQLTKGVKRTDPGAAPASAPAATKANKKPRTK